MVASPIYKAVCLSTLLILGHASDIHRYKERQFQGICSAHGNTASVAVLIVFRPNFMVCCPSKAPSARFFQPDLSTDRGTIPCCRGPYETLCDVSPLSKQEVSMACDTLATLSPSCPWAPTWLNNVPVCRQRTCAPYPSRGVHFSNLRSIWTIVLMVAVACLWGL